MRYFHFALFLILTFLLLSCKPQKRSEFILNENFNKNNMGWIEEYTNSHSLKIDSGFYFIHSKDTTGNTTLTSTSCLEKSHLIGLPEEYEIETRIQLINSELDEVSYGIFLIGASIDYALYLNNTGNIELFEYDYTTNTEKVIVSDSLNYSMRENQITIRLAIFQKKFILFVNNYLIGNSEFQVEAWQDLRLFTTKQSEIAVDYLTIEPVTLEALKNSSYDYDIKDF